MDEKIVFTRCEDGLESVSLRLKKLNNMIMAISLGMQQGNKDHGAARPFRQKARPFAQSILL